MTTGRGRQPAARSRRPRQPRSPEPRLRNVPRPPGAWCALLDRDDVAAVESKAGALALVQELGQLNLHYGFAELEAMRLHFGALFERLKGEIPSFGADYVRLDTVAVADRHWIEPLLRTIGLTEFGDWADMERTELDASFAPPEVPAAVRLRRATAADHDRIVEIEADAHGDHGDGTAATRERLRAAAWAGVLEDQGEIAGYAVNSPVADGAGRVLSLAVDPEWWGEGYGVLLLHAATYQLASAGARSAVVRVRPAIPHALATAQAVGFAPGTRGLEWRRPADEAVLAAREAEARARGVRPRFGEYR